MHCDSVNEDNETLSHADRMLLDAAESWHMMQNYRAAEYELSQITPEFWHHPDVLHLRCRVYWRLRKIALALSSASRFIEKCPDQTFGYIFKAQMLAYDGRPQEGYDLLLGIHTQFPQNTGVPFQLAECAAQAGFWPEAMHWLKVAIWAAPYLKAVALDVKVFKPIRHQIKAVIDSSSGAAN